MTIWTQDSDPAKPIAIVELESSDSTPALELQV